jgi:hypothetical protein
MGTSDTRRIGEDNVMHGFVKGIMVAACAGTAALTIAACGSTSQQTPTANTSGLQTSSASPPTTSSGRHDIGDDDAHDDRGGDHDRDRDRGGDHDDSARSGAIGQVAPATIAGHEVRGTFACNGQAITISGSDAKITLTGACASVAVTGTDDKVAITSVGTISVTGRDDHVTWQSGPSANAAPVVHNAGVASTVSHV